MILLDTGYLLALFDPADELRQRAMDWSQILQEPCLVTEYVLWECVNSFSHPEDRSAAHLLVDHVRSERGYEKVMPTRSYLSQSELPVTIGLGEADKVDSVEITWPSGLTQKINSPPIDQLTVITETR